MTYHVAQATESFNNIDTVYTITTPGSQGKIYVTLNFVHYDQTKFDSFSSNGLIFFQFINH